MHIIDIIECSWTSTQLSCVGYGSMYGMNFRIDPYSIFAGLSLDYNSRLKCYHHWASLMMKIVSSR